MHAILGHRRSYSGGAVPVTLPPAKPLSYVGPASTVATLEKKADGDLAEGSVTARFSSALSTLSTTAQKLDVAGLITETPREPRPDKHATPKRGHRRTQSAPVGFSVRQLFSKPAATGEEIEPTEEEPDGNA